ncbi:MAG: hypothetical protein GDA47_01780 [Rhodospirillales bacterium]|nr:hypothetical protein [Rhodospirillales bacterium]
MPAETAIAEQLMTARREVPNADSLNASAIYFEAPGATDTSRNDVARCEDAACGYAFSLGGETLTVIYRLADVFEVTDPGLLDAVLTDDDGITLLRRRPGNALDHTFYGAWMENAGFIVAADGEFLIPREGDSGITIPGRAAVAGGERESGLPTADASWTGLMVGTFQSGDEVDDILQGQAELTFSVQSNRIGAMFSSIRNIDNPRAADNRIADITFQNLEANADNGTYGTETEGSRIAGAFYGDGRAETAGIFERDNIVAAFGARRVTTN